MRTKFQEVREPTHEEATFIRVIEQYPSVSLQTLCILVFGEHHNANLERKLRYMRERYHNFKFIGYVPKGRIVKLPNKHYRLVREHDKMQRRIHLNIELDLVCAAIEKWNTRKIWGDIQGVGQTYLVEDIDKLIEYQEYLEKELGNE